MPDCGCKIQPALFRVDDEGNRIMQSPPKLIYCPMHAAAEEMMGILKRESGLAENGYLCACSQRYGPCAHHAEINRLLTKIKEADHA